MIVLKDIGVAPMPIGIVVASLRSLRRDMETSIGRAHRACR